jgi:peptide/nickel transport system substrate-binding protein
LTEEEELMSRRLLPVAAALVVVALAASGSAGAKRTTGTSVSVSPAAAPFAQAWANVPRTPQARAASSVLVFGMEQDVAGFNTSNADEAQEWGVVTGSTPVIRGLYMIDNHANYHLDLAKSVTATPKSLTIVIRPDAYWYWQGHPKMPVTAQDFAYSWKQFVDKANNVASTTGYTNITGYKIINQRTIQFNWKPAFADYKDLFGPGGVYPSKALTGLSFNTFWSNCVCGNDGKPISDGPFYLSNYTKGQGVTLKANPYWYGNKPGLKEIDFKLITDTNSEIQAMRGGEVDAISPSPQTALAQLRNQPGLTYNSVPGLIQEHWDIGQGPQSAPLLKQAWMRQAIAMGMDRVSLIKALFGQISPGLQPLNNPLWNIGPNATGSHEYFKQWSFAPKKALAILAKHCTGGPSTPTRNNTAVWTCGGQKAEFRFYTTAGNQRRETSAAIFSQQLGAIGIKLDPTFQPASEYFGTTLPGHDFDIGEYAWLVTPDPSGFDAINMCSAFGNENYKEYCNRTADALMKKAESNLNPTTRTAEYERVAQIQSNDVGIIPLYTSPTILIYKSKIKGMQDSNNPTAVGPTWNAEDWHW